ncbi:MAG: threonine--tRNA ligase, partial [Clostridiales bacterium]|nr:threonine--tRNA ligase [Clostridiales bacterium]
LEKYAGALPLWIAPEQARVLPISDKHLDAAHKVAEDLRNLGIRAEVDGRDEKIGKKIRQAQIEKTPYMLVIGDKEVEEGTLSVRSRYEGDLGSMSIDALGEKLLDEIRNKTINLQPV